MRRLIVAITIGAASLGWAREIAPLLPPQDASGYTLAWNDEFDGDLGAPSWISSASSRRRA